MARRLPVALAFALLTSCATGADEDRDGVVTGGDARSDRQGDDTADEEDTADDEDTGTSVTDTGSVTKDTGTASGTDSGRPDTGTTDTGRTDTGATDTGPTACTGEESEPNGTPATARALGAINDCDGSGSTASGVLSSSTDVDVLTFEGSDSLGCSVNPVVIATGSVTVCMAMACKSGTTEVTCKQGTKTGNACCGSTVEADVNCTGTSSDDTTVTITVSADGVTSTCESYSLAYHY